MAISSIAAPVPGRASEATTALIVERIAGLMNQELPDDVRYSFDEVECSLGFEDGAAGYACTIWDVSGEDDLPWAVYVVDDFGARLLPEYSTLSQDAEPSALDAALQRATDELPPRLLAGEFTRTEGAPLEIPTHLRERLDPMEQPRGGSDDDLLR